MLESNDPISAPSASRVGRARRISSDMPAEGVGSDSPGVAPITQSGRPTTVIVISALNLGICGLLLLFALPTLVSILPYFSDPRSNAGGSGIVVALMGALAIFALPFALLFLLTAVGIWRLRKWGLVFAAISCSLCLVAGLGTVCGIATSPGGGGFFTTAGFLSLVGVLAGSFQLFYLFQRGFRAQFR